MREALGGVSPVPREARRYQGQRAGLVTRTLAGTVDILVVAVALAVGYAGWIGLRFVLDPRGFDLAGIRVLPAVTWALALTVVYLATAWTVTGRTYGAHLMGLRLVDRRGRHPALFVATVRAVLCTLFPIGLVWCVVGPTRRSVQDLLLRTVVIYDWLPEAENGGPHLSREVPRDADRFTPGG